MGLRRGVALLLVLAAAGCAAPLRAGAPWQSPLGREHPLIGRLWDVHAARFVGQDRLVARLVAARFVLLGEKHDNADHHRLQAALVHVLLDAGRRPAVAFEMFTADDAPAIARHLAAAPTDAAGLAEAVGWARSGWPDWAHYRPIAEAALSRGLPILAANLSPATARALARGESVTLPPGLVARHGLDRPLPPEVQRAMAVEMRQAHCGHGSDRMVANMVAAQRARDAQMAESLLEGERDGAVLIAGSGHARTDRGVPAYLRARRPGVSVASVAFVEVTDGRREPGDYGARFGAASLPFDYVWFTPRVDDVDPCARFRGGLDAPGGGPGAAARVSSAAS